jgi:hypothetical protein
VCIKYRVLVYSRDKRRWKAKEKWRRRGEEAGGCIKQQVADALWELAEKYDVGVWYRRVEEKVGIRYEVHVYCGPVVNGVKLYQPTAALLTNASSKFSKITKTRWRG